MTTLNNVVNYCITDFPVLFKDVNYEKSRIKVLDHLFIVIGNGYEWARPNNHSEGGYLTEPDYVEVEEVAYTTTVRAADAGYDPHEKPIEIPDNYFELTIHINTEDEDINGYTISRQLVLGAKEEYRPYEISEYSGISMIPDNVKPDWLEGANDIANRILEFYSTESQYINHRRYPTEKLIKKYFGTKKEKELERDWISFIESQFKWLEKFKRKYIKLKK